MPSNLKHSHSSFVLQQSCQKNSHMPTAFMQEQCSSDSIAAQAELLQMPLTGSIVSTRKLNKLEKSPLLKERVEDRLSQKIYEVKQAIESYREYKSESSMSQS